MAVVDDQVEGRKYSFSALIEKALELYSPKYRARTNLFSLCHESAKPYRPALEEGEKTGTAARGNHQAMMTF